MSTEPQPPTGTRSSRPRLKWLVISLVGLGVAGMGTLAYWYWTPLMLPIPSAKLREYLGPQAISVIAEADRVETFLLEPKEARPDEAQIDGFHVTGRGPTLGEDFARRLGAVLLTDGSHFHGKIYPCFWPHHAYRLWRRDESVDVAICFHCHNLSVTVRNSDGNTVHRAFGNTADAPYAELKQLTLEVFPGDENVRKDCGHP